MYRVSILLVALAVGIANGKVLPTSRVSFPTGDIINGEEAEPHSAPYIVSLRSSGSHFCAGSIIGPDLVLTAGHCLIYNKFDVAAGLHDRKNLTGAAVRHATLKRSRTHSLFSGGVGPYDIGLIKIDPPFKFNSTVNKLKLPTQGKNHSGDATLFGWGKVNEVSLPNNLQTVDTIIIEYKACKKALPSGSPIHPTNICSNSNKNNRPGISACNGDSGGPLVQYDKKGKAESVGIVSWGYVPCGQNNDPSVYTHTSEHIDWIKKNSNF
ncbi:lectizyme-like [Episyrphus balteatus]|uniref:lectizyme-like n=1 Tax=Episyrphus balteatus TaxID=286459 RepID=UPI002485DEF1|nr:lectizyme-like [Episyrphus balteatus]